MTDRKVLHSITAVTLAALLLAMLIPGDYSGRFLSAALLLPLAAASCVFIKKRSILSINKGEILFLLSVIGAVYLTLYYLTGLEFGFSKNVYIFNLRNVLSFILPITSIIITTELIRSVIRAQNDKAADVLCYVSSVLAQVLICGNIHYVDSFNRFMELVGETLFPALAANLLYHYLSKRYGALPNIVYRLITVLYLYVIPYVPAMAASLFALYNIIFPVFVYAFISALYERKRRYATGKKSKISLPITVLAIAIMISGIMLISNQFRFGALVVATPSMTGELNVGDAAIFEKYDDQLIVEGQVIVFERDGSMIIHRVVDIEKIDGVTRYYTKGDANPDIDAGFVSEAEIIGVVHLKIPYVGYPTLWLHSLFGR